MRRGAARRQALTALGLAAITAGAVTTSSATFTAVSPVAQSFSTLADWVTPEPAITTPADGAVTSDATPAVEGVAGTVPGDQSTVLVSVWEGAAATGSPLRSLSAAVDAGGSWSLTLEALADGRYTVRAEQTDAQGNTGRSAAVTFVIDSEAPLPTIGSPADGATVGPTPELSGSAGASEGDSESLELSLWRNATGSGVPERKLVAQRQGTAWSVVAEPALAAGTWSARVAQRDAAGNSGASSLRIFVVSGAGAAGLEIRRPAPGAWVRSATPRIRGRAGNGAGDSATVTVKLYAGDSAGGEPERTLTTRRRGRAWRVVVGPALSDGDYTALAEQIDASGRIARSSPRSFHIDTTPPSPILLAPADGERVGVRPEISGRYGTAPGDRARVRVNIYPGKAAAGRPVQALTVRRDDPGQDWAVKARALRPGVYTIQAAQRDRAGNTGASSPVTVIAGPFAAVAATSISAENGGERRGAPDRGDVIAFSYSAAMEPSSMLDGWDGSPADVTVRFFDAGGHDSFTLLDAGAAAVVGVTAGSTSSGGVNTNGNYVRGTVTFAASMLLSADARTVTVTLGSPDSALGIRHHRVAARDMDWSVSPSATDADGNPVLGGTLSETDHDRDF